MSEQACVEDAVRANTRSRRHLKKEMQGIEGRATGPKAMQRPAHCMTTATLI
jgi:hypothetical protein